MVIPVTGVTAMATCPPDESEEPDTQSNIVALRFPVQDLLLLAEMLYTDAGASKAE